MLSLYYKISCSKKYIHAWYLHLTYKINIYIRRIRLCVANCSSSQQLCLHKWKTFSATLILAPAGNFATILWSFMQLSLFLEISKYFRLALASSISRSSKWLILFARSMRVDTEQESPNHSASTFVSKLYWSQSCRRFVSLPKELSSIVTILL